MAMQALEQAALFGDSGDEIPQVAELRARYGDLWALGDHRLLVGDSTDAADVARLLDGESPGIMITDPPYGVNYDSAADTNARSMLRESEGVPRKKRRRQGAIVNDDRADWGGRARAITGGHGVYIPQPGQSARGVARDRVGRIRRAYGDSLGQTPFCDRTRTLPLAPRMRDIRRAARRRRALGRRAQPGQRLASGWCAVAARASAR